MMLNAFLVVVEFVIFTSFQLDLTLGLSAVKENQSNFVRTIFILFFYDLGAYNRKDPNFRLTYKVKL